MLGAECVRGRVCQGMRCPETDFAIQNVCKSVTGRSKKVRLRSPYRRYIYTGCLVVADDFLLLSNCPEELQLMLNLVKGYAGERRYKIRPLKTTLVSRVSTRTSRIKDKK